MDIVKFIDNIICYLMVDILNCKEKNQEAPSTSLDKTDGEFTLKLYKDSNFIASTT